jgi:hypothetical protein
LLRSKIFDIDLEFQNKLRKAQLITWLENASKLILTKKEISVGANKSYFSPGGECKSAIIQQLKSAKNTLRICIFTISDNEISEEIQYFNDCIIMSRCSFLLKHLSIQQWSLLNNSFCSLLWYVLHPT